MNSQNPKSPALNDSLLLPSDLRSLAGWVKRNYAWISAALAIYAFFGSIYALYKNNDLGVWAMASLLVAVLITARWVCDVCGRTGRISKSLRLPLSSCRLSQLWAILLLIGVNCLMRQPGPNPVCSAIALAVMVLIAIWVRQRSYLWKTGYLIALYWLTCSLFVHFCAANHAELLAEHYERRAAYRRSAESLLSWAQSDPRLFHTLIRAEMRAFDAAVPKPQSRWDDIFEVLQPTAKAEMEFAGFKFPVF